MNNWARSDVYGSAVVLGPTQQAVYRFALGVTEHGRRPSFTLGDIARATGKPVSSVHSALGRLRALGLIGVSARTGRTGGHRLWRIVTRHAFPRMLDAIRHRRAVARVLRRWALSVPTEAETLTLPLGQAAPPVSSGNSGPDDSPEVPFRDRMRDAGFVAWWNDQRDDQRDATDSLPNVSACELAATG